MPMLKLRKSLFISFSLITGDRISLQLMTERANFNICIIEWQTIFYAAAFAIHRRIFRGSSLENNRPIT